MLWCTALGDEVKLAARNLSARGVVVDAITYVPFGTSVERLDSGSPSRETCIWSDTARAGSSSRRPSQAVISPGRSTRSSPSGVTGHVFALEQLAASWSIRQLRDVGGFDSLHLVHSVAKVT
jgi:hypothetical protein